MFHPNEQYRFVQKGHNFSTDASYGPNGLFLIPKYKNYGKRFSKDIMGYLQCIISNGMGWEHVSVCVVDFNKKLVERCPSWDEMKLAKECFWDPSDTVVSFFPDEKNYVNNHPYVLHLWRKIGCIYELPTKLMV